MMSLELSCISNHVFSQVVRACWGSNKPQERRRCGLAGHVDVPREQGGPKACLAAEGRAGDYLQGVLSPRILGSVELPGFQANTADTAWQARGTPQTDCNRS